MGYVPSQGEFISVCWACETWDGRLGNIGLKYSCQPQLDFRHLGACLRRNCHCGPRKI